MTSFPRAAIVVGLACTLLAVIGFGALATGVVRLSPQPASMAQACVQTSNLVPTLVGDDTTTQIRLSTPDLRSQRVLRTEPAGRLPAMFESLLSVSPDGSRLAYVTADDEQMNNASLLFIDVAHPEAAHVIATEAFGMLPIRPVWSPSGDQLAFVVLRSGQGTVKYNVLAASATGGPVLNIASLPPDAFISLESNALCVTPTGSVSVVPPPSSRNGDVAAAIAPVPTSPVAPSPAAPAGPGGGTRCSLPVLSQNDPRWKDHRMQPTGESVGSVGCAVTSAAMVLDYFSASLTPDQLSDCLGESAVPILWSRAAACTGGRVNGAVASEFSWAGLNAILAAGRPAIVGMLGGQIGMHFVVVTRGGGDVADQYRIVDPWNGRSDANLGSYTRHGWTLFQLVDFRSVGPGCGQLLTTSTNTALKIIDGITDGAWYHGAVTIRRLVDGAPVTVIKIGHGSEQDKKWELGNQLTLTDSGTYQVIIRSPAATAPTVLSFSIANLPPTVTVKFLNQVPTQKSQIAASPVMLGFPGRFAVIASDPYTGITSIEARLDGTDLVERESVAGLSNRTLIGIVPKTGPHNLIYSATNAAGLSAKGQVYFTVQSTPVPGPPLVVPGVVAEPRVPGTPNAPVLLPRPIVTVPPILALPPPLLTPAPIFMVPAPPQVFLLCAPLSSVTVTDLVTRTPVGGFVHSLSWQGNGTCGPFAGTITAAYRTTTCTITLCFPRIWTASYQVTGVSGVYVDQTAGNVGTSYTLTLKDSRGNTATGSAT